MQGSNNGKIKMAHQKFKFDDADWGSSQKISPSKKKEIHEIKHKMGKYHINDIPKIS